MAGDRIQERGPGGAAGWLESACKLTITFRAGVLLVTLLSLPAQEQRVLTIAAIAVAGAASFVPLKFWNRVGPALVRRPSYFAAELVLAALILLLTGVQSPFFYFTLGTALLGGLIYGWTGATVFSLMLVASYAWVLEVRQNVDDIPATFQSYVGLPALYLVVAAAGAAARNLLDRQAAAEADLAEQQRAAAAEHERARLARDMHDSLAKTVHGIGFAALALSRQIERDPEAAVRDARRLADDAKLAAEEARDLIAGLRTRDDADLPPAAAVRAEAERWSGESGVAVQVAAEEIPWLAGDAARELVWITREALRNVSRHAAGATAVTVRLRPLAERAVLTVADDGPGFEVPDDLSELQAGRHYGLVGMRERARVAGGDLSVESEPGDGTVISAWVPAPEPDAAVIDASGASDPPASAPRRTVEGVTWQ